MVISGCVWMALSTRFNSSSVSFGLRPQLPVRTSTLPLSRICAASLYTSRSLTPYAWAIIFASWLRSYPLTSRFRVSLPNILFHLVPIIHLLSGPCMNIFSPIALMLGREPGHYTTPTEIGRRRAESLFVEKVTLPMQWQKQGFRRFFPKTRELGKGFVSTVERNFQAPIVLWPSCWVNPC